MVLQASISHGDGNEKHTLNGVPLRILGDIPSVRTSPRSQANCDLRSSVLEQSDWLQDGL